MLFFVELRRFPVGESLAFGDSFFENDGVDALEAVVADVETLHQLLEVDFGMRIYLAYFIKITEIVVKRHTHFDGFFRLEESYHFVGKSGFVNSE